LASRGRKGKKRGGRKTKGPELTTVPSSEDKEKGGAEKKKKEGGENTNSPRMARVWKKGGGKKPDRR